MGSNPTTRWAWWLPQGGWICPESCGKREWR